MPMKSCCVEADHNVYAGQVALLYRNAPLAYSATVINGTILALVQATQTASLIILFWWAFLILVTAGRSLLVRRYLKASAQSQQALYWGRLYLLGAGLAGLAWGASGILLFPLDSPGHQVLIAFVLAGMSAGSVVVLSARLEVCVVFLVLALLPLSLRFFLQADQLSLIMGAMILIFLVGMAIAARTLQGLIANMLSLRVDKRELMTEITKRQRVEENLFQEKERLQTTLASIGEAVVITDAHKNIRYLNPVAEQLCGWSRRAAKQRSIGEVFLSLDEKTRETTSTAVEECLKQASRIHKKSLLLTPTHQEYLIEELATPLSNRNGKMIGAVAVFRDVTEAHKHTAQLAFQANHDILTGLPNRNLLRDRLHHAIAHAQRSGQQLAVLFLDLDHFKTINDSLGHAAGDDLLKIVATRLKTSVRETDTVARLGGDEFVVLLEYLDHEEVAITVAQKILKALAQPFRLEKHEYSVTTSIGVALFPNDGEDPETLLENADTAMYRAKAEGRNKAKFFAHDSAIPEV
jgi:diguanylate cyclase (GGDEF)-like protein/PAS domain S-box-containing protein